MTIDEIEAHNEEQFQVRKFEVEAELDDGYLETLEAIEDRMAGDWQAILVNLRAGHREVAHEQLQDALDRAIEAEARSRM